MDVPNTGAVFTLGKSYLAENTQSYFYIRNDPVKRVISGPYQSAVICESGRLFVWGENRHGQLGIGGSSNKAIESHGIDSSSSSSNVTDNTNNNKNRNNGNNVIGDVVTKPTCVKSLKTLGLKIADIAFGNDWAIILTHSNELFFSGRNIFHDNKDDFVEIEVAGTKCSVIRKPFRLTEFDNWLSSSEEEENFVSVLAGNEHFAVMTSSGRLIGWGSNTKHQLAKAGANGNYGPLEIVLDTTIQQFTCGPETTLVLTKNGTLYLTGKLKEFVFTQFIELQKNLLPSEEIIFMHISKASDIYIVTNTGNIYRSYEAVRSNSLIFQRLYDYDSEENGPIWKLLRGSSFYTVLTKANKFYTTFSESGHHMRTFREISKFKNLRLLDMAVGNQHILVHGIPRSSTLSATMGTAGEHRYMSRTFVIPGTNGNIRGCSGHKFTIEEHILEDKLEWDEGDKEHIDNEENKETPKPNTPTHEDAGTIYDNNEQIMINELNKDEEILLENPDSGDKNVTHNQDDDEHLKTEKETDEAQKYENNAVEETDPETNTKSSTINKTTEDEKNNNTKTNSGSPTESLKSRKSTNSIEFDELKLDRNQDGSSEKITRPLTPYPDSSGPSTPQTAKKTIRNFSYEAAMEHDAIENTTPALHVSLEDITEDASDDKEKNAFNAHIRIPTPPFEEDEELTVEIQTFTDELDQTVNEIRFINNGVDVTPKVATKMSADSISIESGKELTEELGKKGNGLIQKVVKEIDEIAKETVELQKTAEPEIRDTSDTMVEEIEKTYEQSTAQKTATGANNTIDIIGENIKKAATVAHDAVNTAGDNAKKAAIAMGETMNTLSNKTIDAANDAKESIGQAMTTVASDTKLAVSSMISKIPHEIQNAQENLSPLFYTSSGKRLNKAEPDEGDGIKADALKSSFKAGGKEGPTVDEDEGTTASVSSTHTSSGNPFDNGNPVEENPNPSDNDLVDEAKQACASDNQELQQVKEKKEKKKGKVRQFFSDIRSKSKGISCRSEKDVRVEDGLHRNTPVEEISQDHDQIDSSSNTTKVCTIL